MGKVCGKCKEEKPLTNEYFSYRRESANGFAYVCKQCNRLRSRLRQKNRRSDPEKKAILLLEKRKYSLSEKGKETKRRQSEVDNHKRRQRMYSLSWNWSVDKWEQLKKDWDNSCAYCGVRGKPLTQDHFIPICDPSSPGTVPGNMVPACMSCNTSKQHKRAEDWCKDSSVIETIKEYLNRFNNG